MIAAAFNPKPVIVRMSDFKSNEYAHLLGGEMQRGLPGICGGVDIGTVLQTQ